METNHSGINIFYLLLDLFLINLAVFIIYQCSPFHNYLDLPSRNLYFLHASISEMMAYIIYSKRNYFFNDKFRNRLKLISIRFIILVIILFLLARPILFSHYNQLFILEYVALFYLLKVIVFYFIYKFYKYRFEKGYSHYRVAILGSGESSLVLGKLLNNNPILGFKLIGYVSDSKDYDRDLLQGELDELHSLARNHKINMIFATDPKYFTDNNTKELLALCNKTGLRVRYVLMNGYWNKNFNKKIVSAGYFEMFNPQEIPLDNLTNRMQKRIFDIFFSAVVVLLIFSWLIPLLAVIIKFNSKGPVFFVQQRTGINNKIFSCLKFRTMRVNNEADTKQAQKNDDRITSIGSFLRRTNIDELPQFLNVLIGNMSIVGPRPHMLKHTEQYSALIEFYKVRHFVKPGITGWAQVNGYRGLTDEVWKMEKRVEYDMEYLEKWNFIWDIKIIIMTILGRDTYKNAM